MKQMKEENVMTLIGIFGRFLLYYYTPESANILHDFGHFRRQTSRGHRKHLSRLHAGCTDPMP